MTDRQKKKTEKKNKDSFDVGREEKCENCNKKMRKKDKDSFDVGREEKCEASQGRKWPKGQLKACGSIFLRNLLQQH